MSSSSTNQSSDFHSLSPKSHHHYHARDQHNSSSGPSSSHNSFLSNITPHFPSHFPHSNPLQTAHHEYSLNAEARNAKKEARKSSSASQHESSSFDEHGFPIVSSQGAVTAAKEAWGVGHHEHPSASEVQEQKDREEAVTEEKQAAGLAESEAKTIESSL